MAKNDHIRISVVMNRNKTHYAQALEIRRKYREDGVSEADLYAWALIHANGDEIKIPEGSHGILAEITKLRKELEATRAEMSQIVLDALSQIDLSQYKNKRGKTVRQKLESLIPESTRVMLAEMAEVKSYLPNDDDD